MKITIAKIADEDVKFPTDILTQAGLAWTMRWSSTFPTT